MTLASGTKGGVAPHRVWGDSPPFFGWMAFLATLLVCFLFCCCCAEAAFAGLKPCAMFPTRADEMG